jgi:hypothetical protein
MTPSLHPSKRKSFFTDTLAKVITVCFGFELLSTIIVALCVLKRTGCASTSHYCLWMQLWFIHQLKNCVIVNMWATCSLPACVFYLEHLTHSCKVNIRNIKKKPKTTTIFTFRLGYDEKLTIYRDTLAMPNWRELAMPDWGENSFSTFSCVRVWRERKLKWEIISVDGVRIENRSVVGR